jgi:hypothetical protein
MLRVCGAKILEGIETGEAEIFAHDWMKKTFHGGV